MLPPIPQGLIPVTVQQDPPKPCPATPPVAPTQAGAAAMASPCQERDEESWLEEEYRRAASAASAARAARRTRERRGDEAPADEAGRAPRRTSRRARDN